LAKVAKADKPTHGKIQAWKWKNGAPVYADCLAAIMNLYTVCGAREVKHGTQGNNGFHDSVNLAW